jgi:hypothetical protein
VQAIGDLAFICASTHVMILVSNAN